MHVCDCVHIISVIKFYVRVLVSVTFHMSHIED